MRRGSLGVLRWIGGLGIVLILSASAQAAGGSKTATKPPAKKPAPAALLARDSEPIQSAAFKYIISAPPAFVVRHADPDGKKSAVQTATDVQVLLLERQISVLDAEPVEYVRVVVRPLNSQGVQAVSQIYLGFNPAYQRLSLHRIRVARAGKVVDRTRSVKLDLLRRERNLENNLYEGDVTALGILPDVRVDDVIDYEYSVAGRNPIFGNRYAARVNISQGYPLDEFHLRFLSPDKRVIQVRASSGVQLVRSQADGVSQYEVVSKSVSPVIDEVNQPLWYDSRLRIEISEYADWNEVRHWAEGLFKQQGELSPTIQRQLAAWRAEGLPPERLVGEVLRWVQGEVRYFGIELGVNSHLPTHPNQTVERRFGDCKDKSLLLATLLNELGITAQPVLASLQYQRGVGNAQPSPVMFDHVIVRVVLDGKTWWLDATRSPQFGALDGIGAYDYGKVLVLGDRQDGLQDASYPPGYSERRHSVDRYILKSLRDPAELVSESVFRGASAEGLRRSIATINKEEFAKMVRADVQRQFTTAAALGDVEIQDDHGGNRITLTARYRVADLFRYEPGKLIVDLSVPALLDYLRVPQIPQRNAPFNLPYPIQSTQSLIVEIPDNPIRNMPDAVTDRGTYWTMSTRYQADDRKFQVDYGLQANKEFVPASAIPAFIEETLGLRRKLGTTATVRVAELSAQDKRKLNQALTRYDRYGKTRSEGVNAEIRAHIDSLQITRDIESGRLSDKLLAQAYSLRAVAWDNLGEVESSLRDIRKAAELMPDNHEYVFTQGVILLGAGRPEEAKKVFDQALRLADESKIGASDYRAIGIALHYLGHDREAAQQLERSLAASNGEASLYAAFWQHIAAKRSGIASELETQMNAAMGREWPYPIAEMFLGRINPDTLIQATASEDLGVQRDRLCEAYFYIGQKYLLEARPEQARASFEKSVAQEALPFSEYGLALHELNRVKAPRAGKAWWSL